MRIIYPKMIDPMLSLNERNEKAILFKKELQSKYLDKDVNLSYIEISHILFGFYVYYFVIDF